MKKNKKVVIVCDTKLLTSEYEVVEWVLKDDFLCSLKSFQEIIIDDEVIIESNNSGELTLNLNKEYKSIWFRHEQVYSNSVDDNLQKNIQSNLSYNFKVLYKTFYCFVSDGMKVLSSYESFFINKLVVLKRAYDVGLNIPNTLVCNKKKQLSIFIKNHGKIICKSLGENLTLFFDNNTKALKQYVVEIDEKMLKDLPDKFFPTLFQKRIDKQMDIRIFYLDGKFFPMAIFSQCLDYREDYHNHRNVPINLPVDLENKLHQLMQKLDLNTGSIDMVRCAKTKKYYFLEVNPNGQFGMVSKPCNYYLEREIAEFLTT